MLEDSRAGILAKKLVKGEKCPVCGSVHHPEPAELKETSISEDEFKRLQEEESALREKKNTANTEAEKAKTLLEGCEEQLRITILDCLENPLMGMDMAGVSLEKLIKAVREAKTQVVAMSEENHKKRISLEKDCTTLRKAEKDLETAQGDETEKLHSEKEKLYENRQRVSRQLTETKAILETLENLSFPNWETAKREREQAETRKDRILNEIAKAEEEKKKADNHAAAVTSEIKTWKGSLEQQEKDEADLRTKLEQEVGAQGFLSVEEMLRFVVSEEDIASSDKVINEYHQTVAANEKQLADARSDAEGKKVTDIDGLKAVCDGQRKEVDLLRKKCNNDENTIATN